MSTLNPGLFWYWNANPAPSGIRRQLKSMKAAGFRCVYLHTMPDSFRKADFFQGMTLGYLGEKYFQMVRVMLEECRVQGMAMMLYDEGGWPSGSVLGTLVRKHPECKAKFLVRGETGYEIKTGEYPDLLSAHTTRVFIEMVYERYAAVLGDEFGKTIRGFFTDEPFWECQPGGGRIQITDELPALFRKMHHTKFNDILPLLFEGAPSGPAMETARRHYAETCARLFSRNYSRQLAQWCSAHRLDFEGHFNCEDMFFRCGQHGDFMQVMDPLQVPGVDTIGRQIYPGGGQGAFARFASSSAIRMHRKTALCECFNVYGYHLTAPVMSHVANTLLTRGINRLLPMPYLYSDRGQRKICCSTDISPRNPVWTVIPPLNAFWHWAGDYETGALHPEVWLWARPAAYGLISPEPPNPAHEEFARKVEDLVSRLDDHLIFWRFANAGDMRCGKLPKLIVTPGTITEPALIEAEKAGVKIVDGFSPECEFRKFSLLDAPMAPGIRALPCRRKEGLALMVFNSSAENTVFKFSSTKKWRELMPPDSAPNELYPVVVKCEKVVIPLSAGELRILVQSGDAPPPPVIFMTRELNITWRIRAVKRLCFSQHKPTVYEVVEDRRTLPPDGNYTTLEPDFSGVISLESTFELEKGGMGYIHFDSIRHGAELIVNGKSVGIRAFAPWVFKASFRSGRNTLRLKISSSGGNEWRRCFREELEPAGWFNGYASRLNKYPVDDAECGISGKAKVSLLCGIG